jgi:hypothetical protein
MSARASTRPSLSRCFSVIDTVVADAETVLPVFELFAEFPAWLEARARVCPNTVDAPWFSARYKNVSKHNALQSYRDRNGMTQVTWHSCILTLLFDILLVALLVLPLLGTTLSHAGSLLFTTEPHWLLRSDDMTCSSPSAPALC